MVWWKICAADRKYQTSILKFQKAFKFFFSFIVLKLREFTGVILLVKFIHNLSPFCFRTWFCLQNLASLSVTLEYCPVWNSYRLIFPNLGCSIRPALLAVSSRVLEILNCPLKPWILCAWKGTAGYRKGSLPYTIPWHWKLAWAF